MSPALADLSTTLTGFGTLATVIAVITGVALNLRKRPSDEAIAAAAARAAEDAFYKGRLETSEKELVEETALRKAAEESLRMREEDLGKLRRAKDDAVHALRMENAREREISGRLAEHVEVLKARLMAAGLDASV